jgi:hypothetical protein
MAHNDEENSLTEGENSSKVLQISQVIATVPPNPPALEAVRSIVSEAHTEFSTVNERPSAFGSLYKELTIVGLCCCGPMTMVMHLSLGRIRLFVLKCFVKGSR